MVIREAMTVTSLNKYIKSLIENDDILKNVYIKGEISNFKYHSSGHMYFTLKDKESKIKCIMFRTYVNNLKFIPNDGMNVIVRGNVSIYERDGQYQLYCNKMEPDGIGSLYLAFEQLKDKLEKEGLFDKANKKELPIYPRRIGIATSPTGSVIRDIINVSTKRFENVNLLLFPVKVQGDGAAESIISAIEYFNTRDDIEVIIIGRGGGSIEELWAFNEENLARAIAKSRIPIISAVGHETDFTIADFVADVRASTPSHAAEISVPSYSELIYKIRSNENSIKTNLDNNIKSFRYEFKNILHNIERLSPINVISQRFQYVDNLQSKILYVMQNNITEKRNKFALLLNRVDDLSPVKVLKRGYGYVEKTGSVVGSIKAIKTNDGIILHMYDGYAECTVNNVMEAEIWQLKKEN